MASWLPLLFLHHWVLLSPDNLRDWQSLLCGKLPSLLGYASHVLQRAQDCTHMVARMLCHVEMFLGLQTHPGMAEGFRFMGWPLCSHHSVFGPLSCWKLSPLQSGLVSFLSASLAQCLAHVIKTDDSSGGFDIS